MNLKSNDIQKCHALVSRSRWGSTFEAYSGKAMFVELLLEISFAVNRYNQ